MAKALALAPQSHKNLNQIIGGGSQLIWDGIISSSSYSWPRIFCPISNSHFCYKNRRENVISDRRFASVSATPLPALLNTHHPLRSGRLCLRLPSLSLLPLRRSRSSHLRPSLMMSHTDDSPTLSPDSTKTMRCVIKGRVQGVFYRDWTVENATQLGLKGWVRNRRDGSVEALFSGKAEAVDEMLQRCRRGPQHAMVTALEANPSTDDPGARFERRQTA